MIPQFLEMFMLVCFGLSWPIAAFKSLKSRSTKSTSLPFLFLILAGYIAGVAAKFIGGNVNYVLIVYFFNILSVLLNLFVYLFNKKREKKAAQKKN